MAVLHINFTDGSHPFLKYGEPDELKKVVRSWLTNYDIVIDNTDRLGNIDATATSKHRPW